eukprot:2367683-Pleurochrysis_carterae.AAC.1
MAPLSSLWMAPLSSLWMAPLSSLWIASLSLLSGPPKPSTTMMSGVTTGCIIWSSTAACARSSRGAVAAVSSLVSSATGIPCD